MTQSSSSSSSGIGYEAVGRGGDMPEEKVSRSVQRRIALQKGEKMPTFAPAADAGPRQPKLVTCYYNSSEHTRDTHGPKFPCQKWVPTAPPVPQEAAPRCEDCQWHGCGTGCGCKCHAAIAPNWAMRVARELGNMTPWPTDEQVAALIRQAGSERERELLAELESLRGFLPNVAQILDGWHNDGTAWSEWDESIRKQLGEFQKELECLMTQK